MTVKRSRLGAHKRYSIALIQTIFYSLDAPKKGFGCDSFFEIHLAIYNSIGPSSTKFFPKMAIPDTVVSKKMMKYFLIEVRSIRTSWHTTDINNTIDISNAKQFE